VITPVKETSKTQSRSQGLPPEVGELRARYAALTEQAIQLAKATAVRFSVARHPLSESNRAGREAYVALKLAQENPAGEHHLRQADISLSGYAAKLHAARFRVDDISRLVSLQRELWDVQDELIRGGRGRYHRVLSLARRLRSDVVQNSRQPPSVFPLAEEGPEHERRDWLFSSLHAARLLAWTASLYQPLSGSAELLIAVALLNDVGLAFWQEVRHISPWELLRRRPEDFRAHPQLSAALVGGIPDAPAAFSRLVGLHHESLDGGGYPHRLRRWSLPPLARLLQVAVRFTELQLASGLTQNEELDSHSAAVRQLVDEMERGRWEAASVNLLLPVIAFGQNPESRDPPPLPLSEFGLRQWRVDAPHEGPSRPHSASWTPAEIPRPHFLQNRSLHPDPVPITPGRSWD